MWVAVRILLVSTYELGHQPLHVASPAAALVAAGHEVRCLDLSVQEWDRATAAWAEAVAFSVPMHTAMRLAVTAATALRIDHPATPVAFYGLYAPVGADQTVGTIADRVFAGEYEPGVLRWVGGLADPERPAPLEQPVFLGRSRFVVPARNLLPPLEAYARLAVGDERRLAGAVEASHGCSHRCRHCPVPVVYDGRIRVVPEDLVVADVAQLVAMGARHISFADPDFLNGPHHARRVVAAVHASFPDLTFDCTVKVEHILDNLELWPYLAAAGCLFVVSAFESVDDDLLARLDKGHTAADASRAVGVLRQVGIEIRPSWLPFTPWTTPASLMDLLDFVAAHDLVPNVDPVQYTIRLLVPQGSLLLGPGLAPFLDRYDATRLSWVWSAPDPVLDALQRDLAELVERRLDDAGRDLFGDIRAAVENVVGKRSHASRATVSVGPSGPRPRLTEPWFCCSEPTCAQNEAMGVAVAPV